MLFYNLNNSVFINVLCPNATCMLFSLLKLWKYVIVPMHKEWLITNKSDCEICTTEIKIFYTVCTCFTVCI